MPIVKCNTCGKNIIKWPSYIKRTKTFYCNNICKQTHPTLICIYCKKSFSEKRNVIKRTGRKFCSNKCKYESKRVYKKCIYCSKDFVAQLNQIKRGGGKFCSRICYHTWFKEEKINTGKENHNWQGDKVGYQGIHVWLNKTFGKANKCKNPDCVYPRKNSSYALIKSPKRFEWAKLKNVPYERKRENFWMLCASCHRTYDLSLNK